MNGFHERVQRYNEYRHLYHPRPKAPQFNNLPIHHPTQGPFYYTAGDTKIDYAPVGHYFSAWRVDGKEDGQWKDYTWAPSGHVDPLYYCSGEPIQSSTYNHNYRADLQYHRQQPDYYENLPRCPDAPNNVPIKEETRFSLSRPAHKDTLRYADDLSYNRRVASAGNGSYYQSHYSQDKIYPVTEAQQSHHHPVQQLHHSGSHSRHQENYTRQPVRGQQLILNPRVQALKSEYGNHPVTSEEPPASLQVQNDDNHSSSPSDQEESVYLDEAEFELLNDAVNYFARQIRRAYILRNDPDAVLSSDSSDDSIYTEDSSDSEPSEPSTGTEEGSDDYTATSPPSTNTVRAMMALFDPI